MSPSPPANKKPMFNFSLGNSGKSESFEISKIPLSFALMEKVSESEEIVCLRLIFIPKIRMVLILFFVEILIIGKPNK